ncbi:VWA domain-containing protein [Hyphococcus flavus]|uniref:VWA domain-containing protein n=1 Tax=Hyphococcus flavus TaxID=1866326 RepID=A0AAE9ZLL3_9PROT|nr:VWA domain-containing protein [Hyphococcus flavus]WDI32955.1 VWA domain-containing protein [Hyphococcus flavus]
MGSRTLVACLSFLFAFGSFAAADEGDSILVLDASGSMWGQIEGEAKITIAKQVLGDLLNDLPAERRLGLIAYGHNRKGDCTDIEELAAVGAERAAIASAVQGLNPKGKTPMADSIKLAADKLKFTEEKATVILVSDGIETCEPDPCGVAASLEQASVDLTVHVVGFDVTEENEQAQLRCIAENTGGKYVSASDAGELGDALEETVAAAPEVVTETKVRLRATELEGGLVIEEGLSWTVLPRTGPGENGEAVFSEDNAGTVDIEIAPGAYDIMVERVSDGLKGKQEAVVIRENSWKTVTIALTFPVEATVTPDPGGEVMAGTNILIHWTGPDRQGDYITIVEKGAENGKFGTYSYTRQGDPAELRMPVEPGEYEIRYMLGRPIRTLASVEITATAAEATLVAPEEVVAGSEFSVEFTGPPAGSGDWITIVKPDARDNKFTNYHYTKQGSPGSLRAPLEAGDYEIRFVQGNKKVLARKPITVTAALATLSGPETAVAGETVMVEFSGPEPASGDWITVTKPDDRPNKYNDYHYSKSGTPADIRMPLEPGTYELRFVQGNKKVLARQTITVTEATATLSAKDTAIAGETINVEFTGPAPGSGDWVTVTAPDAPGNKYTDYHYTKSGSPADLRMPLDAGEYELRFVQANKKVLARRTITVSPATATLNGPTSAVAGTTVQVEFTGPPPGSGDYVAISKVGSDDKKYERYAYTKSGSPANLRMPNEPGEYELRFIHGNKNVLARAPITVTPKE